MVTAMLPDPSATNQTIEQARLAGVLATDALAHRPRRAANHVAENEVLIALAQALSGPQDALLHSFVEGARTLCHAGSAGISLLEGTDSGGALFRWVAVVGQCADIAGQSTARNECPCGMTLDLGTPQLFVHPEVHFPCLRSVSPAVIEGLVVPIPAAEGSHGAVWVMSHDPQHTFDTEDERLLTHIATFAGAALTHLNARRLATDEASEAQASRALLEDNERCREEFIAMPGHEMRSPMTPIASATDASKKLCADNHAA